jgi:hypothetical protein
MPAITKYEASSATAGLDATREGSLIMTPDHDVSEVFDVGPEIAWLSAFGLSGTDTIRVMMVAGPGAGTLFEPFRPTGVSPPADEVLSAGRTSLPVYFPGRYRLERVTGATTATVRVIKTAVAHDAGSFYNEVTGDTVVNSITVGTLSTGLDVEFNPGFGDVVFNGALVMSPDANNIVSEHANGLYATAIQTLTQTANAARTVDLVYTVASTNVEIGANVVISPTAGNILTAPGNGLYATAVTSVTGGGTATVDVFISGTSQVPAVTANVNVSATAGNLLSIQLDGLYVPATFKQETVIFNSESAWTVFDADVEVPEWQGALYGTAPLTTFPNNALTWLPSWGNDASTFLEVELSLFITSSSVTPAGTDTYLQVELMDSTFATTYAKWRIQNPSGNLVSGTHTLKHMFVSPGFVAPGVSVRVTTTSDATFTDVSVQLMKVTASLEL